MLEDRDALAHKNKPIIEAKNLTRIYSLDSVDVVGIKGVDLSIHRSEIVVLKGESGSGKSTLLSLLAGLDQPSSGSLKVAGHDLRICSEKQLTHYRREVVGMIFQNFNLLPTLSVMENVTIPGLLAEKNGDLVREKALRLIRWLGLSARIDHYPAQLSGGEMQRTAIARALINDPAIILADEPTGNLDSRNSARVMKLLEEVASQGERLLIIATHSGIADRMATMQISLQDGALAHPS
jgi:ABC-type lipoprotein export system ATPase subunit